MMAENAEQNITHVQVRFFTKHEKFAVQDVPYSIPVNVGISELSELLNKVLDADRSDWVTTEFDFLHDGEFLRTSIEEYLQSKSLSAEDVLPLEYVEKYPAPDPKTSLNHDDWVCGVKTIPGFLLTGCYDNTVQLWTLRGEHLLTIPGHLGPVKGVDWISYDESGGKFVSASHDQTLMLWEWNKSSNAIDCAHVCRGHERSVESVATSRDQTHFASGSWDGMVKIWSTCLDEREGEQLRKKTKGNNQKSTTQTPVSTFTSHRESVSSLVWLGQRDLCTASWDHSMKVWDVESGAEKIKLNGAKVFLDVSSLPETQLVLSGSADRHVRLWDLRVPDGSSIKSTYTSHNGWVSCVDWSPDDDNHFISGSYDQLIKLWDLRSPKVPLYNMTGHEDKILCCDWTVPDCVVSGGADSSVKIFEASAKISS